MSLNATDANRVAALEARLRYLEAQVLQIPSRPVTSGSGNGKAIVLRVHQVAHGFAVLDAVFRLGSVYEFSDPSDVNAAGVDGIVSKVSGADDFELTCYGLITTLTGITDGGLYYLDVATAGAITTTVPGMADLHVPVAYGYGTTGLFVLGNSRNGCDLAAIVAGDPVHGTGKLRIHTSAGGQVDIGNHAGAPLLTVGSTTLAGELVVALGTAATQIKATTAGLLVTNGTLSFLVSPAGVVTVTWGSGNSLVLDPADLAALSLTGQAIKLRQWDVCDSGTGTVKKAVFLSGQVF